MIPALQQWLDRLGKRRPAAPAGSADTDLWLAVGVLLLEVAHADGSASAAEVEQIRRRIARESGLEGTALDSVLDAAAAAFDQATGHWDFTRRINAALGPRDKERILECLWGVAWADGRLDAHETHRIRKIAGLLHLPHGAFVASRERARRKASGGGG